MNRWKLNQSIYGFRNFYISRQRSMNNSSEDIPNASVEIVSYRDALPTHFTFKIQSFSQLTTAASSMEKYESNAFEAGGYKWKLVFYPNGSNTTTSSSTQNESSAENHVSMYLKIVDTNSLPRGWNVDVSFRFFVLDQTRDRYLILGDMGGRTRRFHEVKTMWGYSQLLQLTTLNDSSNGYIVDNVCVFGAEVFLCKNTGCGDCLTMVESPSCFKYTWKIENFSKIKEESIYSDVFVSGGYKWKIKLLPKGDSRTNNENVSMFLFLNVSTNALEPAGGEQVYAYNKLCVRDQLHDFHKEYERPLVVSKLLPKGDSRTNNENVSMFSMLVSTIAIEPAGGELVYARFKLCVRDQLHEFHKEYEGKNWFTAAGGWGSLKIMRLDELNDTSKGYLVNDTCIAEAEVTVLGVLKKLS